MLSTLSTVVTQAHLKSIHFVSIIHCRSTLLVCGRQPWLARRSNSSLFPPFFCKWSIWKRRRRKKKLVWEKQSERMKGSLIRTVSRSWDRIWHAKSHCGMYDNGCVCVHVFVCLVHVFLDKCVFFFTQMEGNKRHPNLPQRWVFLRVIFASVSHRTCCHYFVSVPHTVHNPWLWCGHTHRPSHSRSLCSSLTGTLSESAD